MKIIEKELQLNLENVPENALFLDIETTGLAAAISHLYLFGCLWKGEGSWHFKQWLLSDPFEERSALREICQFASKFHLFIEFNGDHFDLPFLDLHAVERGIESPFGENANTLDLYKVLRPIKRLMGMERGNQKSFEDRIGNVREDKYDGGKLISVYHEYQKTGAPELEKLLLLHNEEDVIGMSGLMSLLPYARLMDPMSHELTGISSPLEIDGSGAFASISFFAEGPLAYDTSVTLSNKTTVEIKDGFLRMILPVHTAELKRFFGPAKDYYYLPAEDMAVHKSVSAYVDPSHRVKSTKDNCYIKRTGSFLPILNAEIPDVYRYSAGGEAYGLFEDLKVQALGFWNSLLIDLLTELGKGAG